MGKLLKMRIPEIYFSWKRALGITKNKRIIVDKMGIPMSKSGIERSIVETFSRFYSINNPLTLILFPLRIYYYILVT